jgi:predicted DNA repair protein MutK
MHRLLAVLTVVGTAAMLWVGGHILLVGTDELGWHWPYSVVHDLEHHVHDLPLHSVWEWIVNTLCSALIGLVIGTIINQVVTLVGRWRSGSAGTSAETPAG